MIWRSNARARRPRAAVRLVRFTSKTSRYCSPDKTRHDRQTRPNRRLAKVKRDDGSQQRTLQDLRPGAARHSSGGTARSGDQNQRKGAARRSSWASQASRISISRGDAAGAAQPERNAASESRNLAAPRPRPPFRRHREVRSRHCAGDAAAFESGAGHGSLA
jgi:hypothetical protein